MQRSEIIVILKKLKIAYPRFYTDISRQDAEDTITLWEKFFKNDDPQLVMTAVNGLISTSKFPPSIAEIREVMYKLTNNNKSPVELWQIAKEMISKGIYMSQEEFNKYPEEVRRFFGGLSGLKDISKMESQTVNSVIQSNFLKQIAILQEREKTEKQMLPEVRIWMEANKGNKVNYICEGNTKSETQSS